MAGLQYTDPDMAYKNILAQGERNRKLTEANTRAKQMQINADEKSAHESQARQYALGQSVSMQADPNTTRTVNGTSMVQTNAGNGRAQHSNGESGTASRGLATGGFGGSPQGPSIDGRYMALVTPPSLDENGASTPPQVQMPSEGFMPPDAKAWQDAAFARLKDRAGAMGASAQSGLASELAGRGISGASGSFARGTAQNIMNTVQPLSDLNVEHLGQEYGAAENALNRSASRNNAIYQGGIAQRGQDISAMQALNALKAQMKLAGYSGGINQRGQDLEALYRLL